jgi:DNA modification methylase
MYPKQLLIWVKTNPIPQFRLVGYRQATELMFWALKNKNKKNNPNFLFKGQREMTNVFYAPIVGGKERTSHPTQKPLSITEKIISTHCREGGVVLDPFLGSGTTAVAAQRLKRNFIGIEISSEYCKIANDRLRQPILF